MLVSCERAGVKRVYVKASSSDRALVEGSVGRFSGDRRVSIVDSFDELLRGPFGLDPSEPCVRLNGNLVFATSHLRRILDQDGGRSGPVMSTVSADYERGGSIAIGPLAELVRTGLEQPSFINTASYLPFALNGRLEDREEAEERLARALKDETADTDAPLARYIDRNLSWRISKRLAQTSITPNQVTLTNTIIGLLSAWLFAAPSYWLRVIGSLLFLFSITVDGVDGELARLTMTESKFGGMLDVATDNIVHVAVFAGIFWGCYRNSGDSSYLYLIPVVLGGFGLCALATYLALSVDAEGAEEWLGKIDRISGRDFAYLLVLLALINRLGFFAWGAAFGTYVFAFILLWATYRRWWLKPKTSQSSIVNP
ncbi:MAG TPA: CDP-alcohol phosphatidyltransferase family protein [Candidatus Binataceae bacterium]|nr:CDP-alcohol phosphatidyltransferase family protein [Candidatus Binataceae bacterium]